MVEMLVQAFFNWNKYSFVFNCVLISGNIDMGASSKNLHGH